MSKSNYYNETIPRLIEQYKIALEECLEIIGRKIDIDLNDDKIYNALRGKEKAGEQVKYYAKEIESLENEINGTSEKRETKRTGAERFTTQ